MIKRYNLVSKVTFVHVRKQPYLKWKCHARCWFMRKMTEKTWIIVKQNQTRNQEIQTKKNTICTMHSIHKINHLQNFLRFNQNWRLLVGKLTLPEGMPLASWSQDASSIFSTRVENVNNHQGSHLHVLRIIIIIITHTAKCYHIR